jgi:hypothetical protein
MTNNPPKGIIRTAAQQLAKLAQPQAPKHGYTPKAPGPPDPTLATAPGPQTEQGRAETRSFLDTYFTKQGATTIIYNGDRQWARVTLTLETAGPVAVGTAQNIGPALSGKGQLLTTNVPVTFTIAKGSRLYVVATGVNRVKRSVEPVPWLEQITGLISALLGK